MFRRGSQAFGRVLAVFGVVCASAASLSASGKSPVSLSERVSGSEQVVVARVERVSPAWQQNTSGDRLIVSRVLLRVEETLKGRPEATTWVEVEGGSLDGLTLHVSDMPSMSTGERGVFFLQPTTGGIRKPFQRGQGIVKLDDAGIVPGTSVNLDDIRRAAQRQAN